MQKIILVIFLLSFFSISSVVAQQAELSTKNKKAISLYNEADMLIKQRKFPEAIRALEQALKKDEKFVEAHLRLGGAHKLLGDNERAKYHFVRAVTLEPDSKKLTGAYLIAGEYFFNDGDYENASVYLKKVLSQNPEKKAFDHATLLLSKSEFGKKAKKNPVSFEPKKMTVKINRYKMHAFPVLTADNETLIFTKRDGVTVADDEDIMISHKRNGEWSDPESISDRINSQFNEGACTMSADGKVLVYASCNRPDGFGSCDLYIAYKEGEEWSAPVNLGSNVNSGVWDSEPSISADGRTIYFASDRKGGYGKEDIWVTTLDENGEWTPAVNLGEPINTVGREVTPFIHANGSTLYFSSTQHPGMGGFDIFVSRQKGQGAWEEPVNLGYPINTSANDNAIYITADGKKGYYSVYEKKNMTLHYSYLYEFDVPEVLKEKNISTYAKGTVYDAETRKKLGADIELIDLSQNKVVQNVRSDNLNGSYLVVLTEGSEYGLYVHREGYLFHSVSFNYKDAKTFDPVSLDIYLQPVKRGNATVLNNIYFKTNEYKLEDKSKTELDKLVLFLEKNAGLQIEFSGHTDDIGSESANQELSLKRAKAVYDYLVEKGIDAKRMKYIGYGKSKPVVPNDSGENRKLNRRIEFRIL